MSNPHVGLRRFGAAAAALLLDLLTVVLSTSVLLIVVTGGGSWRMLGLTVRARGIGNPLAFLTACVLLRYALRAHPFFGRWPLDFLLERARMFAATTLPARAARWLDRPARSLFILSAVVIGIRILLAWTSPGFFSGDDVEIHEMTLGALLHKPWPVWDLRCAFFPMVFVYPAQKLAAALGACSPEALVLAGRASAALLSTAALPLTWWAGRRLEPADPRVAAVAVLLLAVNGLMMSFGSSELPRPVSTVFVLAAFLCAIRGSAGHAALAGMFLGCAVAFRFSEAAFLPAALVTVGHRHRSHIIVLLISVAVTAAAVVGVSDALFWGEPFHSVRAALDYTIVRRQSSRGYEPFWEYVRIIPAWSTWLVVGLAVAGSSRGKSDSWWLWTPIAILSLLPHKESRYLVPVVPFLCVAAARGFLRAAGWIEQSRESFGWRRWARDLAAPILLLSVLQDAGGWRLPRSNEGVHLAQVLRLSGRPGLAVQDAWRLGGRPYLFPLDPIVDVSADDVVSGRLSGFLTGVRWLALRSREARTGGDEAARASGFTRDPEWRGEDYVLYSRPAAAHGARGAMPASLTASAGRAASR